MRSWQGARAVAVLAAAALAVGIGSATTIYTVVEAVMLKPLMYRDGERFVAVFSAAVSDPEHFGTLTLRDVQALGERTRAFDAFGWFRSAGKNLMFDGQPFHVEGVVVTASLAHHVGVDPVLGQWFHDDQGVMISSPLWRQLGGDRTIVGRPLTLDGRTFTVAGVMPELFRLPVAGLPDAGFRADVWMPLDPGGRGEPGEGYFIYARRRPGVTYDAAVADLKRVAGEIAAEDPANHSGFTVRVFDLREIVIHRIRQTLLLLFAAAGLLFLITCANAAGLLLARSVARARETAVRVALGARRWQLAGYYFSESLLVALAGAAGGVLLSLVLTPAVVSMAAEFLPRAEEVAVDWTALLFAATAAVVASGLASLAPLWQAIRTAPADALGQGVRVSAGTRSRRLSRALVVAEIAFAFGLLAASAVLVLHLRSLSRVSVGFDPDRLLTFVVSIPGSIAANANTRAAFQRRLVEAIDAVPGVDDVGFANQLPLDGCCMTASILPEGLPVDPRVPDRTSLMAVSPGYVRTMRIPLRTGRLLTDRDLPDDRALALLNQAAVDRYWGGQDPVGRYGRFNDSEGHRFEIVGVVGDTKNDGLNNPTVPEIYILSSIPHVETMHFVVRSVRAEGSLLTDIRRAVQAIDPEQPIHDVTTMREIIQRGLTLERLASYMTTFFATAALALATLGIFGVVSYSVRQRTVEIGTRMALGATRRDVLSLIIGSGLTMAAIGVLAGGVAAVAGAVFLGDALSMPALGPTPFLYSTAIVAGVAVASSSLPAWRATLLSPLVAIRNDTGAMWGAVRRSVAQAVRQLATPVQTDIVPMGRLINEFAGSVRQAASSAKAVQDAIAMLREHIQAESILLLEKKAESFGAEPCAFPAHGFLINRMRHYPHPVAMTDADFIAWRRWAQAARPAYAAEIDRLSDLRVRLAVPLRAKSDIVGVLLLGRPNARETYTPGEKQLVGGAADILALMIENARLAEREVEQEKIRRDLALAGEVQRRLLPPEPPKSRASTLAAFTLPARTVGGDYYDFLDLGAGRIGVAVADVSGKGIAAALVMSVVQASLRVISTEPSLSPAPLAARMNAFLHQATGANKYATFFYAAVEEGGRQLHYVNAGHNPPFLARRTGDGIEITELTVGGTVLGLFPGMEYDEATVPLRPGDVLVAFTDGVPEALNDRGEEFGEERVKALLRSLAGAAAADICATLGDAMRQWIGTAEQYDDLTVVVLAVN